MNLYGCNKNLILYNIKQELKNNGDLKINMIINSKYKKVIVKNEEFKEINLKTNNEANLQI